MNVPAPQRLYTLSCPACGAAVELRALEARFVVCPWCRSTLSREGERLARVGEVAELFTDHSPLQVGCSGVWAGRDFRLVGCLQFSATRGPWKEWCVAFDQGPMGLLREEAGAFVFSLPATLGREAPESHHFRVGRMTAVSGQRLAVSYNAPASLLSATGELAWLPPAGRSFIRVELRGDGGNVLSLDYAEGAPRVWRGHTCTLRSLRMQGGAPPGTPSVRHERGEAFPCPQCGAPLAPVSKATRSMACPACACVTSVGAPRDGTRLHSAQPQPLPPRLPLGATARLRGLPWQVLGHQLRRGWRPGEDDHPFRWAEYVLYNAAEGFAVLMQQGSEWVFLRAARTAPLVRDGDGEARHEGRTCPLSASHFASTEQVLGEFPWPVERGTRSWVQRYVCDGTVLLREDRRGERVWLAGGALSALAIERAFGIAPEPAAAWEPSKDWLDALGDLIADFDDSIV